ncbi:MAG: hypothetical protein DWQ01_22240 [Planctomycetota bacterium]|nr:MAG: hypothetical protein DWQ01_22240 [Planctomycetota bacterium]
MEPFFSRRLPWLLALLPVACATPQADHTDEIVAFIENHYEAVQVGAPWDLLLQDFTPEAEILHYHVDREPPELQVEPAAQFFSHMGPGIDSMRDFSIVPVGIDAVVYDRIATVWAYVEVRSVNQDGVAGGFDAVDQFSMIRDPDGQWYITHLLYQHTVEDWPPPRRLRRQNFMASSGTETSVAVRYSSNAP